jgi:hypothetical protein
VVTVTGNTFNNNGNSAADSWAALEINEADSVTVSNNTITNTQPGSWGEGEALQFWHITPTSLTVTCNNIINNYQGIYFPGGAWASDLSGVHINRNNIYGNTQFGVWAEPDNTGTADAENNWWGNDSGPSGAGSGSGDAVSTNVDYDPWTGEAYAPTKSVTPTTGGTAYFTTDNGNVVDLTAVPPPAGAPAGVTFPYGMFEFTICCMNGSTATLSITLPGSVPIGTKWYKYNGGLWSPLPIGDDNGDNFITVTLQDNVSPDDEDTIVGQITDQGGPGYPGAGAVAVGWDTYPISKVRVLLPWIGLLAAIMAGVSLLAARRRRAQS